MTSRDTHDIQAYAEESKGENIQPELLVQLMIESEPCLFFNKSQPIPVTQIDKKIIEFENWGEG